MSEVGHEYRVVRIPVEIWRKLYTVYTCDYCILYIYDAYKLFCAVSIHKFNI